MEEVDQVFEIDGIGSIKIKRRRGQKSTTLRISRRGEIVLGTNYSTPQYMLKKFAIENRDWIEQVRTRSGFHEEIEIFDGQRLTNVLKFRIQSDKGILSGQMKFSYKKGSSEILIKVSSDHIDLDSVKLNEDERQDLERVVVRALRIQAKDELAIRLKDLALRMGVSYSSMTIRNTSSRWGSCSSRNDINLSLWLMMLPDELSNYVLVHELVHVKFKHHGKDFWDEVARWVPNHKELRLRMKKHSAQVWW